MSFNLSSLFFYRRRWQYHWSIFVGHGSHMKPLSSSPHQIPHRQVMLSCCCLKVSKPQSCYCSCVLACPAVSSSQQAHANRWLCFHCGLSVTLESHFDWISFIKKKNKSHFVSVYLPVTVLLLQLLLSPSSFRAASFNISPPPLSKDLSSFIPHLHRLLSSITLV